MGMGRLKWTYTGSGRRYHAWADDCRKRYGGRVQKVAVDAGFSCPNRDGTVGVGGCTFCNNEGFNPSYCQHTPSVTGQLQKGLRFVRKRYPRSRFFVAYLQAYSNTHATPDRLKEVYGEALDHPDIQGLVIATRPDCVDEEKLSYLKNLSHKYYIKLEYGLESCHDVTLDRVNRGHTFSDSVRALELTASYGLDAGIHLLFGLPGETRDMMLSQVALVNELPVQSLKMHQLQIVKGTAMSVEYQDHPERFELFTLDEYLSFVARFLERLHPDIAIERFSGEVPLPLHEGLSWGRMRADQVQNRLDQLMQERDTWQGKFFSRKE